MSFFQSASAVRIEHSTLNTTRDQINIGRDLTNIGDQTNIAGDQIIHNSNNGTSQTTPTLFIIVRAYM